MKAKKIIPVLVLCAAAALAGMSFCALSDEPDNASPKAAVSAISVNSDSEDENVTDDPVSSMTLEDKIARMFIVTPEQLVEGEGIKRVDAEMEAALELYPVSGIICFSENIESADQIKKFTSDLEKSSRYPLFICVDEEGGSVDRFKSAGLITPEKAVAGAREIGLKNSRKAAFDAGATLGEYCREFGFNVDFAPVADVYTTEASGMLDRSFGSNAYSVAEMAGEVTGGLLSVGVNPVLKHFPGHGATNGDSHYGAAVTLQTLDGMRKKEFIPFEAGIEAGAPMVMVGHISAPNVTDEEIPASISGYFITDILRNELGFEGVIVSDSFQMEAITHFYGPAEAAVEGVKAGLDQILMPQDFAAAYEGLLQAVQSGEISEERIDESLRRVYRCHKPD